MDVDRYVTLHGATVTLCQRRASGAIDRRQLPPMEAALTLMYDERNGLEIVGGWIEWGSELDVWNGSA